MIWSLVCEKWKVWLVTLLPPMNPFLRQSVYCCTAKENPGKPSNACANIGNDTDSIATMAGQQLQGHGARFFDALPEDKYAFFRVYRKIIKISMLKRSQSGLTLPCSTGTGENNEHASPCSCYAISANSWGNKCNGGSATPFGSLSGVNVFSSVQLDKRDVERVCIVGSGDSWTVALCAAAWLGKYTHLFLFRIANVGFSSDWFNPLSERNVDHYSQRKWPDHHWPLTPLATYSMLKRASAG